MSDKTDYRAVNVPADKNPRDYHWTERRAEILDLMEEAGHPDHLNQTQLAQRYGTSQSNISKDFKRLRSYLRTTLGDNRQAISETVYRKAIRAYMDDGQFDKAIDSLESWNEWLREEGVRDVEAEETKHDVNVSPDEALMDALRATYADDQGRGDMNTHVNADEPDDTGVDGISPEEMDGLVTNGDQSKQ